MAATACGGGGGDSGGTTHVVSAGAATSGSISPSTVTVSEGATASFTITPDGGYGILDVTGCNGSLNGNTYTTGSIFANCTVTATFALPGQPALSLSAPKTFRFNWVDVSGATHYKLLENSDGMSGFTQVGADIAQGVKSVEHVVPLYARMNAQYILQAHKLRCSTPCTYPYFCRNNCMSGIFGI